MMGRMEDLVKGKKRRMLSVLAIVLILTIGVPFPAMAARIFTDIGDGKWYDTPVLEAYEAGLITGYSDATFKPDDRISKGDVIICLSRMIGYAKDRSVDAYIQKYNDILDSNNIQSWAKGYIAFGLEKGIVTEDELVTFIKSDGETANNAKRSEVAIYFSKALGLGKEAKSYTNLVLGFVDNEMISKGSRGYIKTLLDRGIMKGDDSNRFNPNNEITRAEVATMLSSALKYVEDSPKQDETGLEGTVQEVVTSAGRAIIKIVLADGNTDIYDVAAEADIRINGLISVISNIAPGQRGSFGIKDNKIISIDITSSTATKGIVRSVFDGSDYRSILIEGDEGSRATYRVLKDTIIELDGSPANLRDINLGDRVSVTVRGSDAIHIEAEGKTKNVLGIFGGFKAEDKMILILKKGAQETEYPVEENVRVIRDDKRRGVEDLRKGDEIEIITEYGVVIEIRAESQARDLEGILESLLIARPHQLTIKKNDGETETFLLPVDVSIRLDGEEVSVYDLRLDYILDIKVESDEIVRVRAEAVTPQNEMIGTVEYVNTGLGVISLRVSDAIADADGIRQIFVDRDTQIRNFSNNRERTIGRIEPGDSLMVRGRFEAGYFIADRIIITNK